MFRWDTQAVSDTPEFRYTTAMNGEEQLAGVMDAADSLPEGVPAHWSVYFGVDDTDAALSRTVELGGSILLPAEAERRRAGYCWPADGRNLRVPAVRLLEA